MPTPTARKAPFEESERRFPIAFVLDCAAQDFDCIPLRLGLGLVQIAYETVVRPVRFSLPPRLPGIERRRRHARSLGCLLRKAASPNVRKDPLLSDGKFRRTPTGHACELYLYDRLDL